MQLTRAKFTEAMLNGDKAVTIPMQRTDFLFIHNIDSFEPNDLKLDFHMLM